MSAADISSKASGLSSGSDATPTLSASSCAFGCWDATAALTARAYGTAPPEVFLLAAHQRADARKDAAEVPDDPGASQCANDGQDKQRLRDTRADGGQDAHDQHEQGNTRREQESHQHLASDPPACPRNIASGDS